MTPNSGTPRL